MAFGNYKRHLFDGISTGDTAVLHLGIDMWYGVLCHCVSNGETAVLNKANDL